MLSLTIREQDAGALAYLLDLGMRVVETERAETEHLTQVHFDQLQSLREDLDAQLQTERTAAAPDLLAACRGLVDYRDRAGPLNFQLEKMDGYIHQIRVAIDAVESEGG